MNRVAMNASRSPFGVGSRSEYRISCPIRNDVVKPNRYRPERKTLVSARTVRFQPSTPALSPPMYTLPRCARPTIAVTDPTSVSILPHPGRPAGRSLIRAVPAAGPPPGWHGRRYGPMPERATVTGGNG
jgi:hypothetical protein